VGVAELSAGRVAGARDAEAMSRLGNYGDFSMTFNLESLVLPDSQFHHFYTSSSRPIFGPSRFEFNGVRRGGGETVAGEDSIWYMVNGLSLIGWCRYLNAGCKGFRCLGTTQLKTTEQH
jgi:hypothetical protein